MTLDDAVAYFGTKYKIAKACGFSLCTPYAWAARGFIPFAAQMKIERITNGKLKANYDEGRA